MNCPTELEWLEHITDKTVPSEWEAHASSCPRCQGLLATYRAQEGELQAFAAGHAKGLERLDLSDYAAIGHDRPERASRGEIWWTSFESHDLPAASGPDRLLVLVIEEKAMEADREWLGVTPIWPDQELASDADLLLGPEDTTLAIPFRVQLPRRTLVERDQLDARLGQLVQSGLELLEQALRGEVGAERMGTPYESPWDWRLEADRRSRDLWDALQRRYDEALAGGSDDDADDDPGQRVRLVMSMEALPEEDHEFFLAAKKGLTLRGLHLRATEPDCFEGWLRLDFRSGFYKLLIKQVIEEWQRHDVDLRIQYRTGESVRFQFRPEPDTTVQLGEAQSHDESDIAEAALVVPD